MRFVFPPFELDEQTLELSRDGEPVSIGGQALSLLLHLVHQRGRVVSREELHELLWKGAAIGETSLGQVVRQARRALGGDAGVQHYIRNVRGRGYRFAAPVEEVGPQASPRVDAPAVRANASPGAAPFLGRRAELALLEASLADHRSGRGDALWIRGEEGIGKSRLLDEVASRARNGGACVLQSGCVDSLWALPYGPFAELIAATHRLAGGEALWSELGEDAGVLALVARSGAGAESVAGAGSPPREEDRMRVFGATARLFEALAARRPLVILIDDLHWAEPATLAMTHHIARRAPSGGWLVVGSARDGEHDAADTQRLTALLEVGERRAPLKLAGLDAEDTGRLLAELAGRQLPADFVEDIQRETGGNPFFAREIFRHLLDEGALVDEQGEWSESLRLDAASVPEGVTRVLSRRLAGLGVAGRELLATAAAAGGTFHFEVVRRAAELDEVAALDGLDESLETHIVEPTRDAEVYAFCHDLTRRVLYAEQSPARRVRLHRRLAESLCAIYGPRADQHAERIARQFHASADLPGAEVGVSHCLVAADRAAAVSAWEDEASFVGMALDLLLQEDERRPWLLERHGLSLAFSGDTSAAARAASQAAGWIEGRKGRAAAAEYLVNVVTGVAWGASELAWDLSDAAEKMLDRQDPLAWARLKLVTLWREASLGETPFDSPAQRAATVAALDNWDSMDHARKNGLSLVGLAFESRREVLERAGDTAVFLALWAGEYERAIDLFHEDIGEAESHAEIAATYFYLSTIGRLHAALGRIEEAQQSFDRSESRLAGLPPSGHFSTVRASIQTEIAQVTGTGFEALVPIFEDLALNADEATQWLMPTVLCVGAEVFAHAGRDEEAMRMLEAGLPGMVRSPGWMTSFTLMVNSAVGAVWRLGRDDWSALLEKQLLEKTLTPDFRFPSTDARLSMARLCTLQERYREAEAWFAEAREVLEAQGARPLRAIVDLDEARMLVQRGEPTDPPRAAELLASCGRAFRAIGMPGWAARAAELRGASEALRA